MLKAISKTSRNLLFRLAPSLFWRGYEQKARAAGIKELYIVLSYDCDTPEDARASLELFDWLASRAVSATFAVPGAQLLESQNEYISLKKSGADFINHGGAPHTHWRDGRYRSITFYEQMSEDEVQADIHLGHEIIEKVLGEAPQGFRAPHFGHFQHPDQLKLIYDTLHNLETYRFSTTTTSTMAKRYGPVMETNGLIEIPIIGSYYWPLRIFDSWRYVQDPISRAVRDDYARVFLQTLHILTRLELPAVLNYYADPVHVYKNISYFKALEQAVELGVKFISYAELLKIAQPTEQLP